MGRLLKGLYLVLIDQIPELEWYGTVLGTLLFGLKVELALEL